jgi:hypothetical protein
MTPERFAELVCRWARFYTRKLPAPIARRRVDEITADLHDHIAHERAAGVGDRRIARGIASRMLRGLGSDLAWRRTRAPGTRLRRSVARVACGVALILAVPFVGMQVSDGVAWNLGDFLLAGLLVTTVGVVIELALKRTGNLAAAIGVAALGVAAGILGQADDAPGLVLLGILLIASALALGMRTAGRKG